MKDLKLNILNDAEMEKRDLETVKGGHNAPEELVCKCGGDPVATFGGYLSEELGA